MIRRLWTVARESWPVWLFFVVLFALAGAWHRGADSVTRTPCPVPASPVIVYVPADEHTCPEEDSCRIDYHNGRWTLIREVP